MMIAIPEEHWRVFAAMTDRQFIRVLLFLASQVNLKRFPKARRGAKKPPPTREADPKKPHVSTARILADRKN
jgi:hypothetical protein